jgi:LuxR family transcriptional regulator, maltose regulon positive regulatory protein
VADAVLAVTKLHVPEPRSDLLPRDALLRALVAGRDAKLTLISAPPGSGKTTLLTQWCAAADGPRTFAWLSLDPSDADPVRFWRGAIEALRVPHPGFGAAALSALTGAHDRLVDVVVPLLVNEAAALAGRTVLVLDDLHVIGDPAVHGSLAFLLDRLPPALRLVVATRRDPPLPLARLRARGELCELRGADLRLSDGEAAALLERRFGLQLPAEDLVSLQASTEGWAAALQLAALWLERGASVGDVLAAPDVLEYLAGEVLDAQPPELRRFLLDTAILERLSAPLCDALTGGADAAERLPELYRANLLVVPLDGRRRWWRYHHLFAELLRRELARETPARAPELHRRAAAWHAEHGSPGDAIAHAIAAGDHDVAARLAAEHWSAAFNAGELATVESWLAALPDACVVGDPRLWLARLWTAMDSGRLEEAGALLDRADRDAAPEARVWGQLLHALHAFKRGDLTAAEDGAARAAELDPDDRFWRTVAACVRGLTAYARGRPSAVAAFEQAAELASADRNRLALAYALGYRALIAAEAGLEDDAEAALVRLDELLAEDAEVGEHFVALAGGLARAALDERQGAYEAAAPRLERAVELARRGAGTLELAHAQIRLGHVQWARGRRDDARRLAREARRQLDGCADPGRLTVRLQELERRAQLRAAPVPREELSDSELAVLRLLPSELSNREIGERLYVSVNTVKTHVRSIYAKLRAQSRDQAVGRARELGLL